MFKNISFISIIQISNHILDNLFQSVTDKQTN